MTDEHEPQSNGIVAEIGTFDASSTADQRLRSVAKKIENHGEVHAQFTDIDGETELRLGTTLVDYDADQFEVWDGDNYQSFPVENMDRARKPMDVLH
jgi:hypothetical protein